MEDKFGLAALAALVVLAGCTGAAAPAADSPLTELRGVEDGPLCAVTADVDTTALDDGERLIIEAEGISAIFHADEEPSPVTLARMKPGTSVAAYSVDVDGETVTVYRNATMQEDCSLQ